MALEDTNIVRITDVQSLLGQDILNVFFYIVEVVTTGVTLADFITEFKDLVIEFTRDVQVPELNHARLIAENMTNEVDIDSSTINLAGTDLAGGATLPSYTAAMFRLFVDDKTTRRGRKSLAGIGEDTVLDNDYNGDPIPLGLAELAMSAVIPVTHVPVGEANFTPIVVGRFPITGHLDISRFSVITSAAASPIISTQNSRKAPLL